MSIEVKLLCRFFCCLGTSPRGSSFFPQSVLGVVIKRCIHRSGGLESLALERAFRAADIYGFIQTSSTRWTIPLGIEWINSCVCSLGSPLELSAIDPHAMQDNGQFASDRNDRHTSTLRFHELHSPCFECREANRTRHQTVGSGIQRPTYICITGFGKKLDRAAMFPDNKRRPT